MAKVKKFDSEEKTPSLDFSKIAAGAKTVKDATLDDYIFQFNDLKANLIDKGTIAQALFSKDQNSLREISNFFFQTSGIYERFCQYLSHIYRYDWILTPIILNRKTTKSIKVENDFYAILNFLENSNLKKLLGDIALKVIKNGCYYGLIVSATDRLMIQELPVKYCRSRYHAGGKPAVEFNMKFFDENFKDSAYKLRVINLFPKDIQKGYALYKAGKLPRDFSSDDNGWYLLDNELAIKFNLNEDDCPKFVNAIPAILDLDAAQELDRKKMMQRLLKILIQKLPTTKDGELIFDMDEAQDIHNNAVQMLKKAVGVDIITTFADIEAIDLADKTTTTSIDDLSKVERSVFNSLGTSQNLFNTEGNTALEKSILNDEAIMKDLLFQFQNFLNFIIVKAGVKDNKNYSFKIQILETSIYNYKDLAKTYKEQSQLGYSKILPQIALGNSQLTILNSIYFENEILKLNEIMIPVQMSSTQSKTSSSSVSSSTSNDGAGRPELVDDKKADKTIQNKEAKGEE